MKYFFGSEVSLHIIIDPIPKSNFFLLISLENQTYLSEKLIKSIQFTLLSIQLESTCLAKVAVWRPSDKVNVPL